MPKNGGNLWRIYFQKTNPWLMTNGTWKNRNKKIWWLCLLGRNSHILNSSPSMLPCCHWPSSWMEFYLTLPRHGGTVNRSNKSVGPKDKNECFFFSTLGSPLISGSVEVRIRNFWWNWYHLRKSMRVFVGSPTTWSRIFSAGSPLFFLCGKSLL